MAKIVEITQQPSVTCKAGEKATAEFSVTNISDKKITVGLRVITDNEDIETWFSPDGGPEWQFEQGENKPIHIAIQVPEGTDEGSQNFCIEVFSAEAKKGGIDFTTGEKMALQVSKTAPPPPSMPWLWIAVATVLVLVIAGGATWYFLSRVPNVVGESFTTAQQILTEKEYAVEKKISADYRGEAGIVVDQEKGDKDSSGKNIVMLYVPGVEVPNLEDMNLDELLNKLIELGLGISMSEKTSSSKKPKTVISHNPVAGEVVEKGAILKVVLAKKGSATRPTAPNVSIVAAPVLMQMNSTISATKLIQLQKKHREFQRQSEMATTPQQ